MHEAALKAYHGVLELDVPCTVTTYSSSSPPPLEGYERERFAGSRSPGRPFFPND